MAKRTNVCFDAHEHRVEIFRCGEKEIRVDHLRVGDSYQGYLKFVNTDDRLMVSGDYGTWTFCRPFVPSEEGSVSEHYWLEKLTMHSVQDASVFDSDVLDKQLNDIIGDLSNLYGEDVYEDALEWYTGLLEYTDDETEYLYMAHRDLYRPDFIDYDDIPNGKVINPWLEVVFDAFDEICRRCRESGDTNKNKNKKED